MTWRLTATLVLAFSISSSAALGLTCQQVRQLTAVYLKMHYSFNNFDDELSQRTMDLFVKYWDPGKLYFYQADIDQFKKKYGTRLDDLTLSANCKAIDDVVNVFARRFEERQSKIPSMIKLKHDFKKDEYMNIDRKKMNFAQNTKELDERWRKRIKFQHLQLYKTLKDHKKVQTKLTKRYKLVEKRQNDQTQDQIYARFLNAFSTGLDPHSDYMSAEELEDFRIQTSLSLEGIGAVLRSEDGFTVIQSLVAGGAAARSNKLKVDDKIIMVAQEKGEPVDVIDMELRDVVKLIRGTGGTTVRLTIVRENKGGKNTQVVVPIVREKVQLTDRTAKSKVFKVAVEDGKKARVLKVGVLNLPSFYMDFEGSHNNVKDFRSSSRDMLREIEKLSKDRIDALVLDIRTNGGGALRESINVAGLFFDSGPVVQIKETTGEVRPKADTDGKTYYNGPLLVMISRQSASASEILAGAIQDYGRGVIVGDDHTFGKGTVQNLHDIGGSLGATKVTISKFYRPSGSSTQLNGVASDIEFPSFLSELEIGEKHYDYALEWDRIPKTPYTRFNQVAPYLAKLKKRSTKRIKKNKLFKDIAKEIAEYKKNEKDRSRVSLKDEKDPKEKDKKDEEKSDAVADEDFNLKDDAHLQETLLVAADYITLLKKQKLGNVSLPELKNVSVADIKKDKKK